MIFFEFLLISANFYKFLQISMNFYDLRTFVMKYSCRDLRTFSAISFGWKVVFANFYAFLAGLVTVSNIRHATRSSSKAGSPSRQRRCPAEILVFSQRCCFAWRWRWWTFDISEFLVCFSKEKVRSGMLISMAGFDNKNNSKSVESLLISNWGSGGEEICIIFSHRAFQRGSTGIQFLPFS